MSDWPSSLWSPPATTLSVGSLASPAGQALRVAQSTFASGAWPTASLAVYIPFLVEVNCTVYQIGWENAATLSGNVDVGIYSLLGSRLVSSGSVAQAGASAFQAADVTDTPLTPGVYFLGMAADNTTATFQRAATPALVLQSAGCRQQASAFALPSSATFASFANAYLPNVCAMLRAV